MARTQEVRVARRDGSYGVAQAEVHGYLAVYRGSPRTWVVVHPASGYAVALRARKSDATAIARELGDHPLFAITNVARIERGWYANWHYIGPVLDAYRHPDKDAGQPY